MKELRLRVKIVTFFLLLLLAVLVIYAAYSVKTYGTRWFSNGRNVRVVADKDRVTPGRIYDADGTLLRYTNSEGARVTTGSALEQSALVHVLGDEQNQVSNGVEKFQARYLYGFDSGLGERLYNFVRGEKQVGDNISLTIDRALQSLIVKEFQTMPALAGKNGAAVVMDYKTGAVRALVSLPVFDPHNIPDSAFTDPRNPFFNRATQSVLPPGSTFKLITMAGALTWNEKAASASYFCDGSLPLEQRVLKDYGGAIHNELSLTRALEVSCNNVFAKLALEMGDANLKAAAEAFGFNDNFLFADMVVENSTYPDAKNLFERATVGIGQSRLLATPMHMCMITAGIANEGKMMEPLLLKEVQGKTGAKRFTMEPTLYRTALPAGTANFIKEAMLGVVKRGTGKTADVPGMQIAGKTGSAESFLGGKPVTHSWFVGFSAAEGKPYAVCVMVEAGGTGGRAAAPLAKKIFEYLKTKRYQ